MRKILHIGSNYAATKDLSVQKVGLYIERDLRKISNENPELSMAVRIYPKINKLTKRSRIDVEISIDRRSSYSLFKPQIEKVLWSYNKQRLTYRDGCYRTHYLRFRSSIKYRGRKDLCCTKLSRALSHRTFCACDRSQSKSYRWRIFL